MLGSSKLDGIRALYLPGNGFISRSGKSFRNIGIPGHFQELIKYAEQNRIVFDGEFWSPTTSFQEIISAIMSADKIDELGKYNIGYYIFDALTEDEWEYENEPAFEVRYRRIKLLEFQHCSILKQVPLANWASAQQWFEKELAGGGEGLILRDPKGHYKHGRCTFRERNMLKMKAFVSEDAVVIGYEQQTSISDEAERERDSLGKLRSVNTQEDRIYIAAIGSLLVRMEGGTEVKVGAGFDYRGGDKCRYKLWEERDQLIGRTIEFKFMKCGMKDKPRFPTFIRFREAK